MAILRKKEIKEMTATELEKKREQFTEEVFKERGQVSTHGKPNNPGRYREMRRTIARINTALKNKKKPTNTATASKAK